MENHPPPARHRASPVTAQVGGGRRDVGGGGMMLAAVVEGQKSRARGIQSSVAVNNNASDDADEENELPQPSSPSVKKSEEKGIVIVHEVKCKLYIKSTDPADKDSWKDKGTGQLSIKRKEGIGKGSKDSKPTIVVRNDVGKVLLNALLYPGIKTSAQKNSVVAICHTSVIHMEVKYLDLFDIPFSNLGQWWE